MAAKWAWLAVSSVPLAVFVNDCILGVAKLSGDNGGAGMRVLGLPEPAPTTIHIVRKRWTLSVAPLRPGDTVLVEYVLGKQCCCVSELYAGVCRSPMRPGDWQALRLVAPEDAIAVARTGRKFHIRSSRSWLEADEALRDSDTEDSCLYGGVRGGLCAAVPHPLLVAHLHLLYLAGFESFDCWQDYVHSVAAPPVWASTNRADARTCS
jgi:hypothetical protein